MKKVWFLVLLFSMCGFFSSCATLPMTSDALQRRDAYFKNPNNDVMLLIEGVKTEGSSSPGEIAHEGICEVQLTESMGGNSNTRQVYTPYVLIYPVDDFVKGVQDKYNAMSASDKVKFKLALPQFFTVTVFAQSQASYAGVSAKFYYAGKEQVSAISSVDYGAVHIAYTLPVDQFLKDK